MKAKYFVTGLIFCLSLLATQVLLAAASEATKTMAGIMMGLNHYPSDAEKETLKKLINEGSTTDAEKTIATAMINLEHSATAEDKKKLGKVTGDNSVPEPTRTLAGIVSNLNHKPSS
ncbi:hypothetical protein, partial [Kaarinaea lacus]